MSAIESALRDHDVTVLVPGDPTVYSLTSTLKTRLGDKYGIKVIPGIGASTLLFSRLAEPSDEVFLLSVHGRRIAEPDVESHIVAAVRHNRVCVMYLDNENNFVRLCGILEKYDLGHVDIAVGINLSLDSEELIRGSAAELSNKYGSSNSIRDIGVLHIMRALNADAAPHRADGRAWLADSEFIRNETPMTKEEIRTLAMCKLRPAHDSIIIDAGAGTGSVAVQCALLAPYGRVYAVERDEAALRAIEDNRKKFGLANLTIVPGNMPEALLGLPAPTHIFVGGSQGMLPDILNMAVSWGGGIRVVVNAVTLKTAAAAAEILRGQEFTDFELIEVQISRQKGESPILSGGNPVFIISANTNSTPQNL
jgi:precorrin-6Y C5,15-methyltransferase (decarboxylating)